MKGLCSFIGAVKVLACVIPGCAALLAPLDDAIAGKDSKDSLHWSDDMLSAFAKVKEAFASNRTIHLPRPSDQLWIVTDGAVKFPGIGATLYITRNNKLHIAGYFSAKLRNHQTSWIPCEIEALSIAAATEHFSPYIIQSEHRACILTDSRPCVMAFEKLCRDEFSASPRVTTFLSVISRYQISIRHVTGVAILPSDCKSHNAQECDNPACQVSTFVTSIDQSVVRSVTLKTFYRVNLHYPSLANPRAHLLQGTRPSRKLTNVRDVKRYLKVATVAANGLLVVKHDAPFEHSKDRIIIPRQVLHGFLMSLHIQLSHPTAHQLRQVSRRYFFALDMEKAVEDITSGCHQCTSLKQQPQFRVD